MKPLPNYSRAGNSGTGGWLIVILVVVAVIKFTNHKPASPKPPTIEEIAKIEHPEPIILAAAQPYFNARAQKLFEELHPIGTAKNARVHNVVVTDWRPGNSRKLRDIRQFTITYTVYWSGPLTSDGFTKVERAFDGEIGRWLAPKILVTNGTTNAEVNQATGLFLQGFIEGALRAAAEE